MEGKWTETHVLDVFSLPLGGVLDILKMSKIDDPPIRYYKVRDSQSKLEQNQSHFLRVIDYFCDHVVTIIVYLVVLALMRLIRSCP